MKLYYLIIFMIYIIQSFGYIIEPGPMYKATVGEIWPQPSSIQRSGKTNIIDPNNFDFQIVGQTCDILEKALKRYKEIIKLSIYSLIQNNDYPTNQIENKISEIYVNLTAQCENYPHLKMDEWYYILNNAIISHSIWGILRGLESYSQLITPSSNGMLKVPNVRVHDAPRFPHRGLLLDTSRHYINMETILKVLDGMSYNKLNVFHWHIVDDQSFPYVSKKFPELSEKGAYVPWMIYSQENVSTVIEYARLRGIRVIAEFDVPGHTRSWGISHPEILTKCGAPWAGSLGPINPIQNSSYTFLREFFNEIMDVFPDKYVHLGGDEVGFECWESNHDINRYIRQKKITYTTLQKIFMEKVTRTITEKSYLPIVWQEAMVKNVNMPEGTIVQVWLGAWQNIFKDLTSKGHRVLLSECWYLDHLDKSWSQMYKCDPLDFGGTEEQEKLVMGGEACMWSEMVNDENVLQRIFPRVSAAAERLWSNIIGSDRTNAYKRLEEHTCRMKLRGIPAQPPSGPGIC